MEIPNWLYLAAIVVVVGGLFVGVYLHRHKKWPFNG